MSIRQGDNIIANKTVPSIYTGGAGIVVNHNVITAKAKYTHDQSVAARTWEIQHDLNDFPSVTVVDSAGTVFDCRVTYVDSNHCRVEMNLPIKGKAYLN